MNTNHQLGTLISGLTACSLAARAGSGAAVAAMCQDRATVRRPAEAQTQPCTPAAVSTQTARGCGRPLCWFPAGSRAVRRVAAAARRGCGSGRGWPRSPPLRTSRTAGPCCSPPPAACNPQNPGPVQDAIEYFVTRTAVAGGNSSQIEEIGARWIAHQRGGRALLLHCADERDGIVDATLLPLLVLARTLEAGLPTTLLHVHRQLGLLHLRPLRRPAPPRHAPKRAVTDAPCTQRLCTARQ
jgi:hypothetical protein